MCDNGKLLEIANERLRSLKAQSEQLVAQLNMVNGAIQDAEFWINQLNLVEETDDPAEE